MKGGGGGGKDEGGEVDSGRGSGGGVGNAEDCNEVEMGMGAESFSSNAYSGTCGRHGQWKDSKKLQSIPDRRPLP